MKVYSLLNIICLNIAEWWIRRANWFYERVPAETLQHHFESRMTYTPTFFIEQAALEHLVLPPEDRTVH